MNVFILHPNPITSASYMVDDHVAFVTIPNRKPIRSCKMAIEALQLLASAHWFGVQNAKEIMQGPKEFWPAPYRPTHQNHPWAVAARSSVGAYQFILAHAKALLDEHAYRTDREMESVRAVLEVLATPPQNLTECDWLIPVCRAGLEPIYVVSLTEAVQLYQDYYRSKIERMPRYTRRSAPEWFIK